jgi:hypothetical protein
MTDDNFKPENLRPCLARIASLQENLRQQIKTLDALKAVLKAETRKRATEDPVCRREYMALLSEELDELARVNRIKFNALGWATTWSHHHHPTSASACDDIVRQLRALEAEDAR